MTSSAGVELKLPEIDLTGLDPGIREHVAALRAGGIETFESCQGSPGHAYEYPTVCFHGDRSEGFRALHIAVWSGLQVTELVRYWDVRDGEPCGPYWRMKFAPVPFVGQPSWWTKDGAA